MVRKPDQSVKDDFARRIQHVESTPGQPDDHYYHPPSKSGRSGRSSRAKSQQSRRTGKSGKSVKSLSIALTQERKKRKKLQNEVADVKQQLAHLYETLSNK